MQLYLNLFPVCSHSVAALKQNTFDTYAVHIIHLHVVVQQQTHCLLTAGSCCPVQGLTVHL